MLKIYIIEEIEVFMNFYLKYERNNNKKGPFWNRKFCKGFLLADFGWNFNFDFCGKIWMMFKNKIRGLRRTSHWPRDEEEIIEIRYIKVYIRRDFTLKSVCLHCSSNLEEGRKTPSLVPGMTWDGMFQQANRWAVEFTTLWTMTSNPAREWTGKV